MALGAGYTLLVALAPAPAPIVEAIEQIDVDCALEEASVLKISFGIEATKLGSARVSPLSAPLVLLVWGPLRVVPVQVESVAITEQAFDTLLNPVRAKVDLGLRTLSRKELKTLGAPFDTLDIVNQIAKEVLARTAPVTSVAQIGGSLKLF